MNWAEVTQVLLQVTKELSPDLPRSELIDRAAALNLEIAPEKETLEIYQLIGETLNNILMTFPNLTEVKDSWVENWSNFWRPSDPREELHPEVGNWFNTIGDTDFLSRENKKSIFGNFPKYLNSIDLSLLKTPPFIARNLNRVDKGMLACLGDNLRRGSSQFKCFGIWVEVIRMLRHYTWSATNHRREVHLQSYHNKM